MTEEDKAWIDSATYEDMLRHCRFAPIGDRFFVKNTELNDYFKEVMDRKRDELDHSERVAASKFVGF